jgi:hypothetical protein
MVSKKLADKVQIWMVGNQDQVIHQMNKFTVKRIATDRFQFTPLISPSFPSKYITILVREAWSA